jgi:ABC-type branched-subunit amino acid transport system substrate-binding protein
MVPRFPARAPSRRAWLRLSGNCADPIKIGMVGPLTGPGAESNRFHTQGAKPAVDEINKAGGVFDRPLELVIEDDRTTNPGAILAFRGLGGNADITAFLGPIRSARVHAMAPDVLKLGKPVMIGCTDPALTHWATHGSSGFRQLCPACIPTRAVKPPVGLSAVFASARRSATAMP